MAFVLLGLSPQAWAGTRTFLSDFAASSVTVQSEAQVVTNGWDVSVDSDVVIEGSGTVNASHMSAGNAGKASLLALGGNWNQQVSSSVFFAADSTVVFVSAGSSQTVNVQGQAFATLIASNTSTTGGLVFLSSFSVLNFTASALPAASTITFAANSTATIANLTLQGSSGKPVAIRSTTPGTYAYLNNAGANAVTFVDVQDSNASPGQTINANDGTSVNSGHNKNWNFGGTARYWVKAAGTGNWSDSDNWATASGAVGGAGAPTASQQAIFDAGGPGNCLIDQAVSVSTLTISTSAGAGWNGYIDTSSNTVTVSSFTMNNGTFYARTSSITVNGSVTISSGAFYGNGSTITVSGDWDSSGLTKDWKGFSVVNLTGTGILKQSSGGSSWNYGFSNLSLAATGKTTTLASSIYVKKLATGSGTLTDGPQSFGVVFFQDSGDVFVDGGATLTFNGLEYKASGVTQNVPGRDYTGINTLWFWGNGGTGGANTLSMQGNLSANSIGIYAQNSGSQNRQTILNTNGYGITATSMGVGYSGTPQYYGRLEAGSSTITINGNVTVYPSTSTGLNVLNASSSAWTVSGNWVSSDTFNAGTSTVAFVSASAQTVNTYGQGFATVIASNTASGGLTFQSSFSATNFTAAGLPAASTITFQANSTATITNLTLQGSSGKRVAIRSSAPGTYAYLDNTGANAVTFVDVQDNNASPGIAINANDGTSVNSGHNKNWNFGGTARYWVKAAGTGNWSDSDNWGLASGAAGGAGAPTASQEAIFDAGGPGNCLIDQAVSISTLTLSTATGAGWNGYIDTSSNTITVSSITMSFGTFYARTSSITVNGSVTISSGAFYGNGSTITVSGDWDSSGLTKDWKGSSAVNLTGTGILKQSSGGTYWSYGFNNLSLAASGKTTTITSAIFAKKLVTGSGTLTDGSGSFMVGLFYGGPGDVFVDGGATLTFSQLDYKTSGVTQNVVGRDYTGIGTLLFWGDGGTGGANTLSMQGNVIANNIRIEAQNSLTGQNRQTILNTNNYGITATSLSVGYSGYPQYYGRLEAGSSTITINGDVTVYPSTSTGLNVLNASSSAWAVSGNWVSSDTFNAGTSTVAFVSASAQAVNTYGQGFATVIASNTASGGLTFQSGFSATNFTASGLSAASTIYFSANSTATITNLTLQGASGNLIAIRSSTPGTYAYLNNTGANFVSYVDAQDNNASPGIAINANDGTSVNGGHNANWNFGGPIRYWVKAAGTGNWSDSDNWGLASGAVGGAGAPTASQQAVFDAGGPGNCLIDQAVNVSTLTISTSAGAGWNGYIDTSSNTVTVSSFTMRNGTFYARTSSITVNGSVTISSGAFYGNGSTITVSGDWDSSGLTKDWKGFSVVNLTGTGILKQSSGGSSWNYGFNNLSLAATGKTTTLASWIYVKKLATGSGILTDGPQSFGVVFFQDSGDVFVDGGATLTFGQLEYKASGVTQNVPGRDYTGINTLWFWGNGGTGGTNTLSMQGSLSANSIRIFAENSGSQNRQTILNTNNYGITATGLSVGNSGYPQQYGRLEAGSSTITINGSVTVYPSTSTGLNVINASSSAWTVSGNWVSSDTFNAGTSTVAFVSASAQTVNTYGQGFATVIASNTSSGGLTFQSSFSATNFTASGLSAGSTIYFSANSTATITNLTLQGSSGKRIAIRSSTPGTYSYLNNIGQNTVTFVDVQDNNASPGIAINANDGTSVNSGHNKNWNFGGTARYWVKAAGTGNWSDSDNWGLASGAAGGAGAPTASQEAIFDAGGPGNCLIDQAVSVSTLTISTSAGAGWNGYIDTSSSTITVSSITMSFGTFYARTSSITVNGSVTVSSGAFYGNGSTITVSGDWDSSGLTIDWKGTSTVNLTGTGILKQSSGGTYWSYGFNNLSLAASGKTTTITSYIYVKKLATGSGTLTDGSGSFMVQLSQSSGDVFVDGGATLTFNQLIYKASGVTQNVAGRDYTGIGTLDFWGDDGVGGANTLSMQGNLSANSIRIYAGNSGGSQNRQTILNTNDYGITATSLEVGRSGYPQQYGRLEAGSSTITINGSVTVYPSTSTGLNVINASSSAWTVSGNWVSSDTFNAGTSTVAFVSASAQTVNTYGQGFATVIASNTSSGGLTFQSSFSATNFTASGLSAASTIYFSADSTATITNLTLQGSSGKPVAIRSSTPGTYAYLNNTGANFVSYVDAQDNNASPGIAINANDGTSVNGGHNKNWNFGGTARYWVKAAGTGNWSDSDNWATASGAVGGAGAPTASQEAIFDANGAGNCNIDQAVSVSTLTISTAAGAGWNGYIDTSSNTITVSSFTMNYGTFYARTSSLTVNGSVTIASGTFYGNGSTITVSGDWDSSGLTKGWKGTSAVNLTGTGILKQNSVSATYGFNNLSLAAAGKTTTLASTIYVKKLTTGSGTLTDGSQSFAVELFEGSGDVFVDGGATLTFDLLSYKASGVTQNVVGRDYTGIGTLFFWGNGGVGGANTLSMQGNVSANSIRIYAANSGSGNRQTILNTNNYSITATGFGVGYSGYPQRYGLLNAGSSAITVNGNVTVYPSTSTGLNVVNAGSSQWTVSGNWVSSDTFNAGTSTVAFVSASAQTVNTYGQGFATVIASNTSSGGLTFQSSFSATNFTAAGLPAASTITFQANSTCTITNLTLQGSSGKRIAIRSSTPGTYAYLNNTGANAVTFVDVQDNNASPGIAINANDGTSVNSGHNVNWNFGGTARYWVKAAGTGNWSDSDNWGLASGAVGGAGAPTASQEVIFDANGAGNCNIDQAVSVSTLTISTATGAGWNGTIDTSSNTITVSSFTMNYGTFYARTSSITVNGGVTISSGAFYGNGSTITVSGDWDSSGLTKDWKGSSAVNLTGTGILKQNSVGYSWYYGFNNLSLAASGKTTTLVSSIYAKKLTTGSGTLTDGSQSFIVEFYGGSGDVFVDGGATLTFNQLNFKASGVTQNVVGRDYTGIGMLVFYGNGGVGGANTLSMQGSLSANSILIFTYNSGSQNRQTILNTNDYGITATSLGVGYSGYPQQYGRLEAGSSTITINGNVTVYPSTSTGLNVLNASSSAWAVSGNWVSSDTFNAGTSTVAFVAASAQTVNTYGQGFATVIASNTASGGLTFQSSFSATNFTAAGLPAASTITFQANSTATITNLTLQGSSGKRIAIRSSTPGTYAYLNNAGANFVSYVDAQDNNASPGIAINANDGTSVNSGHNKNWNFGGTARYWVKAAGTGNWSDSDNWGLAGGTVGGAGAPTASQEAIFDASGPGNCLIDQAVSVSTLTISTATGAGWNGYIDTSSNTVTVSSFTMNNGTFYARTSSITVNGSVTVSSGAFYGNGSTITVSGDWAIGANADYRAASEAVVFNGAGAQSVWSSSAAYHRIEAANTAGVTFRDSLTVSTFSMTLANALAKLPVSPSSVTVTGYLNLNGQTTGTRALLRSVSTGTRAPIVLVSGLTQNVKNASLQDSDASGGAAGDASDSSNLDSGNNLNWNFPTARYWVVPANGNWSNSGNWSQTSGGSGGASVPGAGMQAIFDANGPGNCLIDQAVNISTLTISTATGAGWNGTLDTSSNTIVVSSFTMNFGTFYTRTSSITVNGSVTISSGAFYGNGSTITVSGDWDSSGLTMNWKGSSAVNLTGTGILNQNSASVSYGFNNLSLAATGKTTTLASSIWVKKLTTGSGTLTDGSQSFLVEFYEGSGDVFVDGGAALTFNQLNYNATGVTQNVVGRDYTGIGALFFRGEGGTGGANTLSMQGSLSANSIRIYAYNSGSQNRQTVLNTNDYGITATSLSVGYSGYLQRYGRLEAGSSTITINGNVTVYPSTSTGLNVLNASSSAWTVSGNWVSSDTFNAGTSTVAFVSASAQAVNTYGQGFATVIASNTASGGLTFQSSFSATNFTASGLSAASTIYFSADSTATITNLTLQGSSGKRVAIRSSAPGTYAYLDNTGANTVTFVDVQDNNASPGQAINAYDGTSVNGGHNVNWNFPTAPVSPSISAVYVSSVAVAWGAVNSLNGYTLEASSASDFGGSLLSSVTANGSLTSLVVESLSANTTYYLRVGSLWAGTTLYADTNPVSTSTLTGSIAGPQIVSVMAGSVTVNWVSLGSGNAEGYRLEASSVASFVPPAGSSVTFDALLSTLTVSGLAPQTTYYFRVGGLNWNNAPNYVFAGSTVTPPGAVAGPGAVTDLSVASNAPGAALLGWTAPGEQGQTGVISSGLFNIAYTTDAAQAQSGVYWSSAAAQISISTSAVIPGTSHYYTATLSGGATYYFRLWTQNAAGAWSALSNGATVQTRVFSPAGFSGADIGTSSMAWSWSDARNLFVDGYRLQDGAGGAIQALSNATFAAQEVDLSTNTLYARRVEAFTGTSSSITDTISRYTLAAPPAGTSLAEVAVTSITLQWNGNGNPAGTRFQAYADTQAGFATAASSDTALSAASFAGLTSNATYYLRVKAQNGDGIDTSYDGVLSTITLPAAPVSGSFASVTDVGLTVAWSGATNVSGTRYQAEISTLSAVGAATQTVVTSALTAPFSGLAPDTTYYARVKALGWAGAQSAYLFISTVTSLAGPTQTSFTNVQASILTFNWQAAMAPNIEFIAEMVVGNPFATPQSSTTFALSATFTALGVNTQYFGRVKTVNTDTGNSSVWSAAISTYTLANAPSGLAATAVSNAGVSLAWSTNGNPDGTLFTVERSTDGAAFSLVGAVTTAGYQDVNLTPGTPYSYRARAFNGNSVPTAYGNVILVMTTGGVSNPRPPAGLWAERAAAGGPGNFQVTYQWHRVLKRADGSALQNLAGYRVYRSASLLTPRDQWTPADTVSGESWATAASDGAVFYYCFKAVDASGLVSDWSAILDDSGDMNHFFLASDNVTRLQLPQKAADQLRREKNSRGADLTIQIEEVASEETGRVVKSMQMEVLDAETGNPVDVVFNPPILRGAIAFTVQNGQVVIGSPARGSLGAPVINASEAAEKLSLFWYNGNVWVKTTSLVNTADNTVSFTGSRAGRFQIRAATRAPGITLTRVYPRIITPNGDGWNDKAIFQFDNPQLLPLSGKIFDLSGAAVADLAAGPNPDSTLAWDGKDASGRTVPGGVYLYQLDGQSLITGTIVVAR